MNTLYRAFRIFWDQQRAVEIWQVVDRSMIVICTTSSAVYAHAIADALEKTQQPSLAAKG